MYTAQGKFVNFVNLNQNYNHGHWATEVSYIGLNANEQPCEHSASAQR